MAKKTGQTADSDGSRQPPPFWPGPPDEFNTLSKEIATQPDRSAAVLAGAYLEWRVKQSLNARWFITSDESDSLIGTDDSPGKLGFTDQCRLAYSLGLVGDDGLKDLKDIARIRNRFAHRLAILSFDDDKIAGLCDNLRSPGNWKDSIASLGEDVNKQVPGDRRGRYLLSVYLLGLILWTASRRTKPEWPKERPANIIFW